MEKRVSLLNCKIDFKKFVFTLLNIFEGTVVIRIDNNIIVFLMISICFFFRLYNYSKKLYGNHHISCFLRGRFAFFFLCLKVDFL